MSGTDREITTEQVTEILCQAFESVSSIDLISAGTGKSGGASESVYLVEVINNNQKCTRFVREVSAERNDPVKTTFASSVDFGTPESILLEGDMLTLLVMEPAKGYPLSHLLPLYLLPLGWCYTRGGLKSGLNSLGRYLGKLHVETQNEEVLVGEFQRGTQITSSGERLINYLNDDVSAVLEEIVNCVKQTRSVTSCIFSDPTPHNIYYSNGNVELIDFTFVRGLSLRDVVAAERGMRLMIDRLPYGRKSQSIHLTDAFHLGYRETGITFNEQTHLAFKVLDYSYVLDRYLFGELSGPEARIPQRFVRNIDIRSLQSLIKDSCLSYQKHYL